jgi:DNA repair exonuclease SbcCD ATPase subunit
MEEKLIILKNYLFDILNVAPQKIKKCVVILEGNLGDISYDINFDKINHNKNNINKIDKEKKYEELKNEFHELKNNIYTDKKVVKESITKLITNNKEMELNIKEIKNEISEMKKIKNIEQIDQTNKLNIEYKPIIKNKNEIKNVESKLINKEEKLNNNNFNIKPNNYSEDISQNILYQNLEDEKNIQNNKFADYDEIINRNSRISNPKDETKKRFTSMEKNNNDKFGVKLIDSDIEKMAQKIIIKYKLNDFYTLNEVQKKIREMNTKSILDKQDLMNTVGKYLYEKKK